MSVCLCLCSQSSPNDSQKRNSVRHKLVSLTLKRKSKITEEVRLKPATSPEATTSTKLKAHVHLLAQALKLQCETSGPQFLIFRNVFAAGDQKVDGGRLQPAGQQHVGGATHLQPGETPLHHRQRHLAASPQVSYQQKASV